MAKESIDEILERMIDIVGDSREKIFEIGEDSRSEYELIKKELAEIKVRVLNVIEKNEQMERNTRFSRNRLAEVSKNFSKFSAEEVKKAYDQASEHQIQLMILREEEKQLREKRDTLERRLVKLKSTVERADELVNQINVVTQYLTGDLQQVSTIVADAAETQKLGLKIIQAQEEERKRLSREIHDGPAQTMANVMLRTELVERVYQEKGIEEALEEIKDLRKIVKESLAEVRRIIYDLRPMALDDLGLVPTLARYLKNVQEKSTSTIVFRNIGKERRLPSDMEVAIFRFVQEAVNNANKHAEAKEILVKLQIKPTAVIATIKDDGKGFDVDEKKEGSFGLIGMRERVNMLDGQLNIHSNPREGTLLMVQIPVTEDKDS